RGMKRTSREGRQGLRVYTLLDDPLVFERNDAPPLQSHPRTEVRARSKPVDSKALASEVAWLMDRRAGYDGKVEPTDIGDQYQRIRPAEPSLNGWNAGSDRKVGFPGQHGRTSNSRGHVDRRGLDALSLEQI